MTQVVNHKGKRLKVGPRGGGLPYIYIYIYRGKIMNGSNRKYNLIQFIHLHILGVQVRTKPGFRLLQPHVASGSHGQQPRK